MNISGDTRISGVIGQNISYTKSPLIHNYWYHHYQMNNAYVCFETISKHFKECVKGLFHAGIIGLNVTVPFKERAFELCDRTTPEAQQARSVNCLIYKQNKIQGHNTDGIGFYNALKFLDPNLDLNGQEILIIGAGGAASAIIAYLSQFNVHIKIINRTFEKAQALAHQFAKTVNISAISKYTPADIIIQTTNVKKLETGNIIDIPQNILENTHIMMDINYGDGTGDFLQQAQKNNIKSCDGSEMLLQQAASAFDMFHARKPMISDDLRICVNKVNPS